MGIFVWGSNYKKYQSKIERKQDNKYEVLPGTFSHKIVSYLEDI
jgi:hypothetical protein